MSKLQHFLTRKYIRRLRKSSKVPGPKSWSEGVPSKAATVVEMNKTNGKAVGMYLALVMRLGDRKTVCLTRGQICRLTGIPTPWLVTKCLKALHHGGWLARKIVKKRHFNLLALKFLIPDRFPIVDSSMTRREESAALRKGLLTDPVLRMYCDMRRESSSSCEIIPTIARQHVGKVVKWFFKSNLPIPYDVSSDPNDGNGVLMTVPRMRVMRWRLQLASKSSNWRVQLQHRQGDQWVTLHESTPTKLAMWSSCPEQCEDDWVQPFFDRWKENAPGGETGGADAASTAAREKVPGVTPVASKGTVLPPSENATVEEAEFEP